MVSKQFASTVNKIAAKHGAVIDIKRNPEVLQEILRELGYQFAEEPYPPNNPCGGTPPQPAPAPSGMGRTVPTNEDIYERLLKLSREVRSINKLLQNNPKLLDRKLKQDKK